MNTFKNIIDFLDILTTTLLTIAELLPDRKEPKHRLKPRTNIRKKVIRVLQIVQAIIAVMKSFR